MNRLGCRFLFLTVFVWTSCGSLAMAEDELRALVVSSPSFPGVDETGPRRLADLLRKAGYEPVILSCDEAAAAAPSRLDLRRCALLALPQAQALPEAFKKPVHEYLMSGGHLLALGAPAWSVSLEKTSKGQWLPAGEAQALAPPSHRILDLAATRPADWVRGSNHPEFPSRCSIESIEAGGRRIGALRLIIPQLDGYDTWRAPRIATAPFPEARTMTVFSARGGPRTKGLVVEWREKDGSRWIATAPLSESWRRFSLPPSAFKSWENTPARSRAGFHPENADQLSVGLAFSHTGQAGGPHEIWIAELGTATADEAPPWPREEEELPIETLTPAYKFYPVHGEPRLRIADALGDSHAPSELIAPPAATISSHPRTAGTGFAKRRPWRWVSLIQAEDRSSGEWRGSPGTLLIQPPDQSRGGGVWAVFTPTARAFYEQPGVQQAIVQVARRMRDGFFLIEGGAEFYTYFDGQDLRLGATAANLARAGESSREGTISMTVATRDGQVVASRSWPVLIARGKTATREFRIPAPSPWPREGLDVTTELTEGGRVIDRLRHQVALWEPPSHPSWVTIQNDGHFHKDGRVWRINGVNYMPSSGIALNDYHLFESWLDAPAYDPEIIERDLGRIERLGFNAVSVFLNHDALPAQNLPDLLRRCRAHHLMVNLSLRPGVLNELRNHPRDEAVARACETFRDIIERNRLARNDTVFAYDIDWEPAFGSFGRQRRTDADWEKWILTHYADVSAAERTWGVSAPRTNQGVVTGPPMTALLAPDGPSTRMVADYRRFLDDWLEETYGRTARKIRELAPRQFVSFRMTTASDPLWESDDLNYQFEGLARALDFLAPESYGQLGRPDGELAILFRIALGRAVAPGKPVIWAETGMSVWSRQAQADDPATLAAQGEYYRKFYDLARQSGADGIFWWWYPGGFRTVENSDFGLINPDGGDRPATTVVREQGARFLAVPFPAPPHVWLPYDRDAHPDGARGVFRTLKHDFEKALRAGGFPGLRATPAHR